MSPRNKRPCVCETPGPEALSSANEELKSKTPAPAPQPDTRPISIAEIYDGGAQMRIAGIDLATVADYADRMRDGIAFPPISVFHDGKGYWVWDGNHRVAAARECSALEILADVRQGSRRDAVLAGVSPFGSARETWLYGLASTLAGIDGGEYRVPSARGTPVPARPWPERPGLFPWGRGDDGQALLWWTEGEPDQWLVVLADPSEGLRAYSVDMTGLLAGWLAGTVTLDYLPRAAKPYFRPG